MMKSNKGITDIVALILVLVIVVVLAAGFLVWSSGAVSSLQASAGSQAAGTAAQAGKNVAIEAKYCGAVGINASVTYRNIGGTALTAGEVKVYFAAETPVNGPAVGTSASVTTSRASTGVFTGTIRITAPGGADTATC